MIFLNSRYANGQVLPAFDTRKGNVQTTVYRRYPLSGTKVYVSYEWVEGDRIDIVASQFYGDPTQWWRIMDANPDIIDPTSILPGTLLRVPRG